MLIPVFCWVLWWGILQMSQLKLSWDLRLWHQLSAPRCSAWTVSSSCCKHDSGGSNVANSSHGRNPFFFYISKTQMDSLINLSRASQVWTSFPAFQRSNIWFIWKYLASQDRKIEFLNAWKRGASWQKENMKVDMKKDLEAILCQHPAFRASTSSPLPLSGHT